MLFYLVLLSLIFFLIFPLKIRVYLTESRLKIYLFNTIFVDQSLDNALKEIQEVTKENIENNLMSKEDIIYLKILKKFKVLKLKINFNGLNINHSDLSIIYGVLYAFLSSLDPYFNKAKISYSYSINYTQNTSFEVNGIFKTNLGKILLEYFRLRRIKYGRTSN